MFYQITDPFFTSVLIPALCQPNAKALIANSFQVADCHNLPIHFILRQANSEINQYYQESLTFLLRNQSLKGTW
jgi:hypothetical protein